VCISECVLVYACVVDYVPSSERGPPSTLYIYIYIYIYIMFVCVTTAVVSGSLRLNDGA
jgi:hypothetical protein